MNIQETLKPVARRLKKEWLALDIDKVGASKHEYGIALKSHFTTLNEQKASLNALLTPGIQGQNINLVIDATLPPSPPLEQHLTALSAFMQHSTALLSPMSLLVDLRTNQMVIRQSQVMAIDYPITTLAFYNAVQVLIPLLQSTVESLCQRSPSPNDARQMAELLSQSFYGALEQ